MAAGPAPTMADPEPLVPLGPCPGGVASRSSGAAELQAEFVLETCRPVSLTWTCTPPKGDAVPRCCRPAPNRSTFHMVFRLFPVTQLLHSRALTGSTTTVSVTDRLLTWSGALRGQSGTASVQSRYKLGGVITEDLAPGLRAQRPHLLLNGLQWRGIGRHVGWGSRSRRARCPRPMASMRYCTSPRFAL